MLSKRALGFLRGCQNGEILCKFSWLVLSGSATGLIPDLSAPRPMLWLVCDVNAVFHHPLFKSFAMFDPENLFRDPRILRLLSYNQPDLRTRNHRSKEQLSAEKPAVEPRKRPLFSRIFSRRFD